MAITTAPELDFRSLLRLRPLAVLFPADVVSNLGSQLARFALTVLVFNRTNSAAASALTYATSFLPTAIGGVVLGRLGDRYRRRTVMVIADLIRAGFFLAMAVPGQPLAVIVTLLAFAVFIDPAFGSAQVSYLADALSAEQFRASAGMRAAADQLGQVVGFGLGGLIVVLITPAGALLVDAGTFVASAVVISIFLSEPRPGRMPFNAPQRQPDPQRFGGLWRDPRTRVHMTFMVLIGLFVLPEALAVPYGERIGVGTAQTGVLVSMLPLGSALGCAVIVRVPVDMRRVVSHWLAISCGVPLLASALYPTWWVSCLCWFAAGLLTAYQVEVISGLVRAIPARKRAAALGTATAWLVGAQGVCFALGGVLSRPYGPGMVIAAAAGVGIAAALGIVWRHGSTSYSPAHKR